MFFEPKLHIINKIRFFNYGMKCQIADYYCAEIFCYNFL
jgi:hypothetical protein